MVHRYDLGQYTCRCGKQTVVKPENKQPWRNTNFPARKKKVDPPEE
jgi:hypothetical protein